MNDETLSPKQMDAADERVAQHDAAILDEFARKHSEGIRKACGVEPGTYPREGSSAEVRLSSAMADAAIVEAVRAALKSGKPFIVIPS